MGTVVRLRYPAAYKMPPRCVVCGADPAPATVAVRGGAGGRLTLRFPACPPCSSAGRSAARLKAASIAVAALFWGLGLLAFYQLNLDAYVPSEESAFVAVLVLVGLVGSFICAFLLANLMLKVLLTGGDRRRRMRRVGRAVTVRDFREPSAQQEQGRIVLDFRDDFYGRDFADVNSGIRARD